MTTADRTPEASALLTHHVEVRGVDIAYSEQGAGPVVFYAHGMAGSRATDRQSGLFDLSPIAAAGFRLISYDARGHGESSGTGDAADYAWQHLAEDLIALADHFSPDAPVSVVGSSMGTGTALHAVTQRPDRFDRLVLTAPPTAWETRAGQTAIYEGLAKAVETSTAGDLATLFAAAVNPPIFADVPSFPPAPGASAEMLPIIFRGAGLSDLPDAETLATIGQKTLILPWATDPGHPLSTANRLADLIDGSELFVAETSADIATWGTRAAAFLGQ
ncbi:alpha/beta fold hydrolase [Glaciihabitans sp. dw_435]|uniref:alpha/beta fold hydrolase n=1 Tax=Glaciihabitans sp. dw_435 TaxID=2720081 RepID=UPI001BD26047|nr:alpha/beta fold hydrolase [Glaciihabitans sp. dw_435]